MNNNIKTNNQAVNMTKTIRWDRINRIIMDGVTRNAYSIESYYSEFINVLGGSIANNVNSLFRIV